MLEALSNVIRLAPLLSLLLGIGGGGLVSAGAAWTARSFIADQFEAPQIRREQHAADVAEFEALAAAARAGEVKRITELNERLNADAERRRSDEATWRNAQVADLLQGIPDYERTVKENGGPGCELDGPALDFLVPGWVSAGSPARTVSR